MQEAKAESGVYFSSETNSTFFTNCCRVAICDDQVKCPACGGPVIGHDSKDNNARRARRWHYAYGPYEITQNDRG